MIRRVRLEDLDEIMRIERQSFPVAWEYSIFLNICLQGGHVSNGESKTLFMDVMERDGIVVGYAVWETDTHEAEGHILNLAIQMDVRRRGMGKKLLSHILDHLRDNGIHKCHLEVRESNVPAKALYESSGFAASAKIPGYYFEEDAIVYSMDL
jgi:ribosomal-protein-alanine N-acetyltransferase